MPLDIGEIQDFTPAIFKAHLKRCADDGEELDIYQNCAFVVVEGGMEYFNARVRAAICCITQLVSLVFLTYEAIHDSPKGVCNLGSWRLNNEVFAMSRISSVCFALYLGSNFRTFMYTVNWKGCYPMLFYKKKVTWMNANWIAFGYFINVFIIMCTAICTIAIMYVSTSVIDIVLNGFALFFIHELDDYMMSLGDYGSIKWDYLGGYWDPENQGKFQGEHDEDEQLMFDLVECDLYWVVSVTQVLVKITNLIMILAPIFLIVCY